MADPLFLTERINAGKAAAITGDTLRTIQAKAAQGLVPSAAKNLAGRWTFDEATLRAWMKSREDEIWQRSEKPQRAATGVVTRSGVGSSSRVTKSGLAYGQTIQRLLSGAGKRPATVR